MEESGEGGHENPLTELKRVERGEDVGAIIVRLKA